MERRDQEEMGNNPMSYTPPQITIQESPVRLPLAPILSTPLTDHRRRGPNAFVPSTRRGSSIFSPTQTLVQPSNPRPQNHHHQEHGASPDPDPDPTTAPSTGSASTSDNPAPQPPQTRGPPPQPVVDTTAGATNSTRYMECLKNHAASMGAHVLDGCGEFMTGGEDALKCAACDCHRNFHRKEADGEPPQQNHYYTDNPNSSSSHRGGAPPPRGQTPLPPSAPPHPKHHFSTVPMPPTTVNFGGTAAESSSEDLSMVRSGDGSGGRAALRPPFSSGSNRRFRTKFRPDQKDRMHEFAMKMGWRIQKQDEQEVQQFCSEVGIRRQVFKVWMHNNKQAMKKRDRSSD